MHGSGQFKCKFNKGGGDSMPSPPPPPPPPPLPPRHGWRPSSNLPARMLCLVSAVIAYYAV
jgi:hypothetical protein